MRRRLTIQDIQPLPVPPDFVQLAKQWCEDQSMLLLVFVWEGYDLFQKEVLSTIPWNQSYEELERSLTQNFVPIIRRRMTGWEPFDVEHGPYEFETREQPPAQSPQYDIAFVMFGDRRIMWPIEAKILHSDGDVSKYINEINANFLKCRYAPFSSEAGMLGYLLKGLPNNAFTNIEAKIPCKLCAHPELPNRDHKTSEHKRTVPSGKPYSVDFRCHHLILKIAEAVACTTS
ncbi:hypothetical protein [Aerosakkonema funiforme]|nr:hypothetical protein [Aerosakkonema funiforme]